METIQKIWFADGRIYMRTTAGGEYSRPLEAFPTLLDATDEERAGYRIEFRGEAVRWESLDEDIHISSFYKDEEPRTDNEVAEIFRRFPQLNVSEIARSVGISTDLLRRYIYGIKSPDPERINSIKGALHELARELATV